jgi:hypothetical protein
MRRRRLLGSTLLCSMSTFILSATAASAAALSAGGPCSFLVCGADDGNHTASVSAGSRGHQGSTVSRTGSAGGSGAKTCTWVPEVPQPPPSDPIWQAHAGQQGVAYIQKWCPTSSDFTPVLWRPAGAAGAPVPTPGEVAQRAEKLLRLPGPVVHRSPTEVNDDQGRPYTWVNMWTWYWTTSAWGKKGEKSKSVSVDGVTATVTARPVQMTLTPGDGLAAVPCKGPGRPWTKQDGDTKPSAGGCGAMYGHVADDVQARLSIRWAVSWTGTGPGIGNVGGSLPALTSQATTTPFEVEQVQVVNVQR